MGKRTSAALPLISGILLVAVIALLVWIVADPPMDGQMGNTAQPNAREIQDAQDTDDAEYIEQTEFPTEHVFTDIYSLYVETDIFNIQLIASDDDRTYVRVLSSTIGTLEYDESGGMLAVYLKNPSFHWLPFNRKDRDETVEIAIPEIEYISLTSGSGNIDITQIKTTVIHVNAESGDIDASRVEASNHIVLESESGNVTCIGFYSESTSASSRSGSIRLEQAYAEEISLNSVSGSQYLRTEMGGVAYFYTSSGNVDVEGREPLEGWVRTTSGNVTVRMPFDPQTVTFSTETGAASFDADVISETDDPVYESQTIYEIEQGGPTMEVYTESGNLILR